MPEIGNLEDSANDSGQPNAVLPPELRGFSWGGFLGSWVWAIGNGAWRWLWALVFCAALMAWYEQWTSFIYLALAFRLALGFVGNRQAWRSRKWQSTVHFRQVQKVWVRAGIGLTLVSLPVSTAIMIPVFVRAHENERQAACQRNLKILALAVMQYAGDHDERLPPGTTLARWRTDLKPYEQWGPWQPCPNAKGGEESYFLNPKLAGMNLEDIRNPGLQPLFFEPDLRHLEGLNVAFASAYARHVDSREWDNILLPRMRAFVPFKRPNKE